MDWQTLAAGLAAVLTAAGGCILVIREITRRDRAAMRREMAELSTDVTELRADLVACRRYAFDLAVTMAQHGLEPDTPPRLLTDDEQ